MATLSLCMAEGAPAEKYRFGVFEVDAASGELRRSGMRVRLAAQPMQVLLMLLERPGTVLSRDEIAQRLWPDGTFVDFDHGVNSAVNRIREAVGDTAANPRFVETLPRRGYRFVAPVERLGGVAEQASTRDILDKSDSAEVKLDSLPAVSEERVSVPPSASLLATAAELPESSQRVARLLFLLLQVMYFSFYLGLLFNLGEVNELLSFLPAPEIWFGSAVVTAAALIPARAFLLSALLFHAPGMKQKYLRLWPLLLILDLFWALAPFLLMHHIAFGVALACVALLVYAPFAQRSLVLMGALHSD